MKTIRDYQGNICYLSDDVYILKNIESSFTSVNYKDGEYVRLISGVDGSNIPGYHFDPEWVTVCDIYANVASFYGVKKSQIEKV
jgi:hypothetical protein